MDEKKLENLWWLLRFTFGIVTIVSGVDKFFNLLADWPSYLSPFFSHLIPVAPEVFLRLGGIIEIIAGVLVLSRWTRAGAYLIMAWLFSISVNLLTIGAYDLVVRDAVMAISAFSLVCITEILNK